MAVNKVIYGGETVIDLTSDTVTADTLANGVTAHDKTGTLITGTMQPANDPVLQEKTVSPSTSSQAVTPDSGYDGLSKVTVNAMPTATQATPSITVSSGGLITATATQSAGYVTSGTKQSTEQLSTQAAQTIMPSTTDKTISSGKYLTGTQTIVGDANLVADNIKSGVSIFGISGTYEGSGGGGTSGLVALPATAVTNNGMHEPGINEYIFSFNGLNSSTRQCVIFTYYNSVVNVFLRTSLSASFSRLAGYPSDGLAVGNTQLLENEIIAYGALRSTSSSDFMVYVV